MNNLLLIMTASGSFAFISYSILKLLLKEKLNPSYRYRLLKLVLVFYLIPIPLLANEIKSKLRILTGNDELFNVVPIGKRVYRKDLAKTYYMINNRVILPQYSKLFIFMISLWVVVLSVIIFIQICKYKKLKRIVIAKSDEYLSKEIPLDEKYLKIIKKRGVRFRIIPGSIDSFTYGIFRPLVVISDKLDDNEKKSIIEHELTHIKSLDFLVRLLCLLNIAVYFYNPLSYLLFCEFNIVSELQCDQRILCNAVREKRIEYGHMIVKNACESSGNFFALTFSMGNKTIIKGRLNMIKNGYKNRIICFILSVILMVSISIIPVLAYVPPVQSQDAEEAGEIAEIDYIEVAWDEEALLDEWNFEEADKFKYTDSYYVTYDGEVFIEKNAMKISPRGCAHKFKDGFYKKHIKNNSGGCIVKRYKCKICTKCQAVKEKTFYSEEKFRKCIHK